MYQISLRERKLNHKHIIQLPLREWKLKEKIMEQGKNAKIFMKISYSLKKLQKTITYCFYGKGSKVPLNYWK